MVSMMLWRSRPGGLARPAARPGARGRLGGPTLAWVPLAAPRVAALAITAVALAVLCSITLMPSAASAQFFYPITVPLRMPDGVELSTDVWGNVFDGTPRPVLLRRSPYGRAMSAGDVAPLLNAGYIVISQDVRGRGGSGGTYLPFFDDEADGRATIDWIAAQSWANGRVGSYSASAEGIVQYMTMAAAPAALSCAHITLATHDVYDSVFAGGAWRSEFADGWLPAVDARPAIAEWRAHEVRDSYWDRAILSTAEMAKIDHPVFIVGGVFDLFAPSQSRVAHELQQHVAPASRGDVFFVLGPWTHNGVGKTRQGQLQYPDDAAMPSYWVDFLQYMAWCLHGTARPPFASVRYYITELTDEVRVDPTDNQMRLLAKGGWRESKAWPPADARPVTLYLGDEQRLLERSADAPPVQLSIDPALPAPTRGGANFASAAGPYDQTEVDARDDVYVASTDAFQEDSELVGTPRALIWASSATSDVDVVVRIEDLTPGGRPIALADGIRRGRFVTGYDALRPLTPGRPALFEVELGPLALRVPRGHAIRIAISAASTPRYEPNPNVAKPLAQRPVAVATTLSIYRDAEHPSRIELPLLSGSVPGARAPERDAGVPLDAGSESPRDAGVEPRDAASPRPALDASTGRDARVETDAAPPAEVPPASAGCACAVRDGSGGAQLLPWLVLLLTRVTRRRRLVHARPEGDGRGSRQQSRPQPR